MKKIILGMAAISALAVAAPAAAQYQNDGYRNGGYQMGGAASLHGRIGQLQARLDAGVRSGAISRDEARHLDRQIRDLVRLERQFSRDGLSGRERSELQHRINEVRQQLRRADGGRDSWGRDRDDDDRYGNRGYGWGSDRDDRDERIDRNRDGFDDRDLNRDGRIDQREWSMSRDGDRYERGYDRGGDRIDRNRDGFDDRDLNRDGRIDQREWSIAGNADVYDRDYDRDDDRRYEDNRRGGIGGIIGDLLGGGAGLRVGQRVSGNLGAVPYEYRGQFRDGNGVYYRSDGRNIYEIDARTDTVIRIHGMRR